MNQPSWTPFQKIGFRFLFIFFTLMASPWNWVPFLNEYWSPYQYHPSFFVQNYLLRLHDQPVWQHPPTGSGDTVDDWVLTGTWFVIALVGCIIWSILDRKRSNYMVLNYWLRVGLRYYLAVVLFVYGFDKIFPLQMPFPTLAQLHTPLGDLSPMRLAWLFIGYSTGYEMFSGIMETLSAVLLSIRRTQLLGGLLMLGTLANVVMMNYAYDIPVKLFSVQLFLMTLYVVMQDYKRLLNFFVLNKPVPPSDYGLKFNSKRDKIIRWSMLGLFWIFGFGYAAYQSYNISVQRSQLKTFELYGSYDVKEFFMNDSLRNSPIDTLRWNQVVMSNGFQPNEGRGMVKRGTYKMDRTIYNIDSLNNLTIVFRDDTARNFHGHFEKLENDLVLIGKSNKSQIKAVLQKTDRKFKLETRPFHWVSAAPY